MRKIRLIFNLLPVNFLDNSIMGLLERGKSNLDVVRMKLAILLVFSGISLTYADNDMQSANVSSSYNIEEITVTGTVVSASDQSPLPGVNVIIKGTNEGTITDVNGNYTLEVEGENTILVFSYVGFLSEEIEVGSQSVVNVSLAEHIEALEEIIVTGLSIERDKESLGYSVSQLQGDEVNEVKADNFADALSGKVAGLQITESSTGVGGSTRIILRGISSISGNNRPLFVIDGVPMP